MAQSRVCLLPTAYNTDFSYQDSKFLKLPHPRTGLPCLFLPDSDNTQLLEVQAITPDAGSRRSWFIGDSITADGRLFLLTPFDPLFILVSILLAAQHSSTDVDQSRSLPMAEIFEEASNIIKFPSPSFDDDDENDHELSPATDIVTFGEMGIVQQIVSEICDVQEISDDLYTYKLSKRKLMPRLQEKITRLASDEVFSGNFPVLSKALATDGLESETLEPAVRLQGMQFYALELLGNYLHKDIEKELRASYNFTTMNHHIQTTQAAQAMYENLHKPKSGDGSGKKKADPKDKTKKKGPTASQGVRDLAKASKRGMKPLTTFFTKKAA